MEGGADYDDLRLYVDDSEESRSLSFISAVFNTAYNSTHHMAETMSVLLNVASVIVIIMMFGIMAYVGRNIIRGSFYTVTTTTQAPAPAPSGSGTAGRRRRSPEEEAERILKLIAEMDEVLKKMEKKDMLNMDEEDNMVLLFPECDTKLQMICMSVKRRYPWSDSVLRILDDARYYVGEDEQEKGVGSADARVILRSYVAAGQTGAFGEDCNSMVQC